MRTQVHEITKKHAVRLASLKFDNATIAALLDIDVRTVYRILDVWNRTKDVSIRSGPGRPRSFDQSHENLVIGLIDKCKTLYLDEIQEEVAKIDGTNVSKQTISRTLQRNGFTRKKISKVPLERDENFRAQYCVTIGLNYTPEQLVFMDESAFDKRVIFRNYGWSLKGSRATSKGHFVRGKRYSLLPALSLDGVIHISVVEGSFTANLFKDFVEGLLNEMNPFPGPKSVLVMDNAIIHKDPSIRELVEAKGMRLVYLPPYSPDFNPIEEGFSGVKAWSRRNRSFMMQAFESRQLDAVTRALIVAVSHVMTPQNAAGWFEDCGYAPGLRFTPLADITPSHPDLLENSDVDNGYVSASEVDATDVDELSDGFESGDISDE